MFKKDPFPNSKLRLNTWPYYVTLIICGIVLWTILNPKDAFWRKPYSKAKENPRFVSLWDAIEELEESNPDSAANLAQRIVLEADSEGDLYSKARAYYTLAEIDLSENSQNESLFHAFSVSKISNLLFTEQRDPYWQVISNCQLSSISLYISEQDSSYLDSVDFYLDKAIHWVPAIDHDPLDSLKALADVFKLQASIVNNRFILDDKANPEELEVSRAFSRQALSIYKELDDKEGEAISLRNLATYFRQGGKSDSAMIYLTEVFELGKQLRSDILESGALYRMGDCYMELYEEEGEKNYFEKALEKYNESLSYKRVDQANVVYKVAEAYHTVTFKAYDKGEPYKIFLDSAARIYHRAFDLAKKENQLGVLKQIGENYAGICEELSGDFSCSAMVARIDEVFEVAKFGNKEKLNAAEQLKAFEQQQLKEISEDESRYTIIIVSVILVLLIMTFLLFYERIKVRYLRMQLLDNIKTLQAQMNPHFISNSLNSIEYLINLGENRKASKYLIEFSRLAHMIIGFTVDDEVTILEEMEVLKKYLSLEKLRLGKKLSYLITVDERIDPEEVKIPPMMLQPFVENAIWHGLRYKAGGGAVSIKFMYKSENQILCLVEDNGVGRKKARELQAKSAYQKISYSTRLIQNRIDKLKILKGTDIQITDLEDKEGNVCGTNVEILIRLIDKQINE